ncbi:hypothetical protein IQ07DRAFT_656319 [Pyrenochaeta sp. DS3sAY3a]|nr:hypothetical protein IQ07DRAFT_656319 [Pyrenochaeta sp. DS3sAY3a]
MLKMSSTALRISSSFLSIFLILILYLSIGCYAQRDDATVTTRTRNLAPISSTTRTAVAATHTIQVGLADHKFRPEVTEAGVGDTIEFRFYPTNHSVVRAEYSFPCIPYESIGSGREGFFSGFHAMDKVLDDPPKFSIVINDTNPLFFYCSAPGSCTTYGMVGAINPTRDQTFETQKQLALDSAYQLSPGEPFPDEAPRPSSKPTTPSRPADPEATPTQSAQGTLLEPARDRGLSPAAIAGIVVGSVAVVVLAALLFFFLGRTKTLKDEVHRRNNLERNASPCSTTPMLDANHQRNTSGGSGAAHARSQQPTSARTPTIAAPLLTFTSPQQQHHRNTSQPTPSTAPNYIAYSPSAYSPLDPTAPMTRSSSRTIAVGLQHSPVPFSPYEPTSPDAGDAYNANLSPAYAQSPYGYLLPVHMSGPQMRGQRDDKLGPYGRQVARRPEAESDADVVPAYVDVEVEAVAGGQRGVENGAVVRGQARGNGLGLGGVAGGNGALHVNERGGPAEMQGSEVVVRRGERRRWAEVRGA